MRFSHGQLAFVYLECGGDSVKERVNFAPVINVARALKTTRSDLFCSYVHLVTPVTKPISG